MRPIAYIVDSYRLGQFPEDIRSFWSQHYVWYARSLYIAGYDIAERREIESSWLASTVGTRPPTARVLR